jgi:hypothetical protein
VKTTPTEGTARGEVAAEAIMRFIPPAVCYSFMEEMSQACIAWVGRGAGFRLNPFRIASEVSDFETGTPEPAQRHT